MKKSKANIPPSLKWKVDQLKRHTVYRVKSMDQVRSNAYTYQMAYGYSFLNEALFEITHFYKDTIRVALLSFNKNPVFILDKRSPYKGVKYEYLHLVDFIEVGAEELPLHLEHATSAFEKFFRKGQ